MEQGGISSPLGDKMELEKMNLNDLTNHQPSWLEQQLRQLLYRTVCPTSLTIAEYQAGLLAGESRKHFEQHLTLCSHCSRELAAMRYFMARVGPDLGDHLFGLPAGRPRLWAQLLSPAALRVRGGGEDNPLIYEAGDFQVTIEVMADATRPGHKTLFGLIVAEFPAEWQVQLSQQGQVIATTNSDELGNFELEGVKTGAYDCVVIRPELEIVLPPLTI